MNFIITMTISGTCLFAIYGVIRFCLNNYFQESWYYGLMKAVTLYFLIPLPALKHIYVKAYYALVGIGIYSKAIYYEPNEMILFLNQKRIIMNENIKFWTIFFILWGLGIVIIAGIVLRMYVKRRRRLETICSGVQEEKDTELIEQLMKNYDLSKHIVFKSHDKNGIPFTMGFFRPIIFYDSSVAKEMKVIILSHELTHIKRRDAFWKFASLLVVLIHWYNPIAWIYKREFERVCEYSCDEAVLLEKDAAFTAKYAKTLLEYESGGKRDIMGNYLTKEAKELKRRLQKILQKNKKKGTWRGIFFAGILVVMNSLTVFAYEDIKIVRSSVLDTSFYESEFAFVPEGQYNSWDPLKMTDYVFVYDVQFVDFQSNVYEINEEIAPAAECSHNYVKGMIQKHVKNADGGCRIYFYNASRCTKCGDIAEVEYISYMAYEKCTH